MSLSPSHGPSHYSSLYPHQETMSGKRGAERQINDRVTEEELYGGSGEPVGTWQKADEVRRAYTRTLKHQTICSNHTDTFAHLSLRAGGARAAPNP